MRLGRPRALSRAVPVRFFNGLLAAGGPFAGKAQTTTLQLNANRGSVQSGIEIPGRSG